MKTTDPVDAARIELLLSDLRLPAIKLMWAKLADQSDKQGWPAARFLAALAEHEIADRARRRIGRHLAEARLPVGKTLASFDFKAVPIVVVSDDRRGAVEALNRVWPQLSAADILENPYVLVGTVDQIVEDLCARRARWRISYYVVHEPYMDAFAPVVTRLADQ
jgi:hypothetical protein